MSLITQGLGPGEPPLQFLMRAFHTTVPIGYVYWITNVEPDTTGAFAPYPALQLTDIITAFAYPPEALDP
jgi:hypothetical protein